MMLGLLESLSNDPLGGGEVVDGVPALGPGQTSQLGLAVIVPDV